MKRTAKTVILSLLCGALAASAASCANSQTYPLTIDGEQIRAGIYIFEQQTAVTAAKSKLSEEQPDLDTTAEGFDYMKQTIEGKSFADWVNDKAVESCREYIAEKRLFESNGLTLTEEQNASVKENVSAIWDESNYYAQYLYGYDTIGLYFESMGIGKQSFRDLQEASEMHTALFDHLYGEGGSLAATDDEINAELKSNHAAIEYIEYKLENGPGAQSYVDRLNNGETFEQLMKEHTDDYNTENYEKELAEAEAAKAEQETSGVTEETEDGAAVEVTMPTEPTPIEVPEENSLILVVDKDSAIPSAEFINQVFEMADGEVKLVTVTSDSDTKEYVVKKVNILDFPDKTEDTVKTIRSELKESEFEEMLKTAAAGYTVTEDSSKGLYKVETVLEKLQ